SREDRSYQSRFCLMQAGHYGSPQHRVRFFIVASRRGVPLPDIPQPTHDFTTVAKQHEKLTVTLSKDAGTIIRPIITAKGIAPFRAVTVADAIDDLKRFHWSEFAPWPQPTLQLINLYRRHPKRPSPNDGAPVVACNSHSFWGYEGGDRYEHVESTSYQRNARCKPSKNLQHFTRRLPQQNVERVLAIPLGGDSRTAAADTQQAGGARGGKDKTTYLVFAVYYGRLHRDGFFPTITTNIGPTAKQGRVLHYSCSRIITVRELARAQGFPDWFIFERLVEDDILTIHRQIGNAVPLPLGRALGRELRRAAIAYWKEEEERKRANTVDLTRENDWDS
ncbi:S-adenosyl-L-methionine-dependent methyltransferase, partial [Schizophyllum fasciatum]